MQKQQVFRHKTGTTCTVTSFGI